MYETYIDGLRRRRREEAVRRSTRAAVLRDSVGGLADLCRRSGATRVRLFGSLATGRPSSDPDIDLAVEGVPPSRFFDLYGQLLMAAATRVDLLDLADCHGSLREATLRDGVDV